MLQRGLSYQIAWWMAATSVITSTVVFFGYYVGWAVAFTYFPEYLELDTWAPSWVDYFLLVLFAAPALAFSWLASFKLASKILAPLNSLASSARALADGELGVRADSGSTSLWEIALLFEDFNHMAEKLQDNATNMASWNAAVAHELRTPLTILKGRVQGAIDDVFPVNRELLESLLLQIDGLTRLVDDLRTVTLADSGKLQLVLAPTSISEEVAAVAQIMKPTLEQAGFVVELQLTDAIVQADSMRIRQALLALLTNTLRHATAGPLRISNCLDGAFVSISVEDSGPGLSPAFSKRAFEPFARADLSRTKSKGGSGLGLSVVRAISQAHGGYAGCRPSALGGSIFEIAIPL